MKTTKISTLFLMGFAACLANAGGESPKDVAKAMVAKYRKAMRTKDLSFFEKGSTADFVYVDTHGTKSPKKAAIAGLKAGFGMMGAFKKFETKLVSAKNAEGGVVFVLDEDIVHPMKMGGKTSILASKMRNETLLVKSNGKWLYKRVKILKENTTLDGKPMNGM
ncbi:nuclear transport factor 2 family protein [Fimbriimonas ginsengisoli]|uniref:DUF4440 domain-containing protein n=1 Tax=Fimbriimonas ginsengisoli Gsoil 348 TaxID=661478 RepID=A0A068NWB0_FIMGI|nr:nuclear transport factor 2 family protein [Fimbriimonas ginsengisoli]AIE87637.1 hypothetical protein OP10G_4269 [Fimbriimonas ginsengisoli Gsoil 348]